MLKGHVATMRDHVARVVTTIPNYESSGGLGVSLARERFRVSHANDYQKGKEPNQRGRRGDWGGMTERRGEKAEGGQQKNRQAEPGRRCRTQTTGGGAPEVPPRVADIRRGETATTGNSQGDVFAFAQPSPSRLIKIEKGLRDLAQQSAHE